MKKVLFCALALVASTAFANSCPTEMKAIDAKLATNPVLAEADAAKVKTLRAEGEKLHKEGKHANSVKSLNEAKTILGI